MKYREECEISWQRIWPQSMPSEPARSMGVTPAATSGSGSAMSFSVPSLRLEGGLQGRRPCCAAPLDADWVAPIAGLGVPYLLRDEAVLDSLVMRRGAYEGGGQGFNSEHKNCTSYLHGVPSASHSALP